MFSLVALALGPAAFGSTAVDRAFTLAELRVQIPELTQQLASARTTRDQLGTSLDLSREELDEVLARQVGALEQLEQVEDELRAARARFDEGIERMYIRGGTAALTAVVFFDDPTEAGIASHYLEAINTAETDSMEDIDAFLAEMEQLRYKAFDAVGIAETDYAERERAFILAAGRVAELEAAFTRLEAQIDNLTEDWREHRQTLADEILETTGATGVLAEATITQASLRASLPLGPAIGIPPGLESTGRVINGIASWYGPGFHGRRSSSGAVFDERDFTIAHKTLPHETLLLITFGDKQAVVMVNDRGPFIEGREFDLSRATAEYLGLGLNRVSAEILVAVP